MEPPWGRLSILLSASLMGVTHAYTCTVCVYKYYIYLYIILYIYYIYIIHILYIYYILYIYIIYIYRHAL